MQPIVKEQYRLTRILLSNDQQDIVLCRKSSSRANSLQKYIINIYKNKNLIRNILPDLSDFEHKYIDQYIEHYIKGSNLHIVLRHSIPTDKILIGKDIPIKDRMEITNNLFIRILELNELKPVHLYSLLGPDNLVIGVDKSIYFNNILSFPDITDEITNKEIVKRLGSIMIMLFKDMQKLPKPLVNFIRICCSGNFDSPAQAYTDFKAIKLQFDEREYNFKKSKQFLGIVLIPFNFGLEESADRAFVSKKSTIAFLLILSLISCSGLFAYDRYLKKDVPAAAEVSIQIAEPEKPYKVYEEKQPELPVVQTYTVQAGDSLSKISRKFYNDPDKYLAIADFNHISNPNLLTVGQIVQIP